MSYAVPQSRPAVLADLLPGERVRDLAVVLGGAALTGLAAQISFPIPGTPVPVTGQTFAVLLVGAALGWRRAMAGMLVYLLAGFAGVPWFTGHSAGVPGATLGYLLGFVVAATLVGTLAARGGDRTPLRTLGTMVLGSLVIYAIGMPYLMANLHIGLSQGFVLGVRPFLAGDALKLLLAAGVLPLAWKVLPGRHSADADAGADLG